MCLLFTYDNGWTTNKWIASVTWHTIAKCFVINRSTFGVITTGARAWINTTLIDASFTIYTIRIDCTFSATCRRSTEISRQAWTNRLIIYTHTVTILATWRWMTAIFIIISYLRSWKMFKCSLIPNLYSITMQKTLKCIVLSILAQAIWAFPV